MLSLTILGVSKLEGEPWPLCLCADRAVFPAGRVHKCREAGAGWRERECADKTTPTSKPARRRVVEPGGRGSCCGQFYLHLLNRFLGVSPGTSERLGNHPRPGIRVWCMRWTQIAAVSGQPAQCGIGRLPMIERVVRVRGWRRRCLSPWHDPGGAGALGQFEALHDLFDK